MRACMFYRRVVVERLQKLFCLGYAVRVPNRYLIGKIPNINKKSEPIPHREEVRISYVWWGKVDSNHRSYKQQIYSLSPLATREFPHVYFCFRVEPVDGLEPPTC